jgi:uncharacterized protein
MDAYGSDKRKLLSAISHGSIFFSLALLGVGIPIAVWFTSDDEITKGNAKEAINFHFNVWLIGGVLLGIYGFLSFISFGLLGLLLFPMVALGFLWHWGLTVSAIVHAFTNPNEPYRYPFIFRVL